VLVEATRTCQAEASISTQDKHRKVAEKSIVPAAARDTYKVHQRCLRSMIYPGDSSKPSMENKGEEYLCLVKEPIDPCAEVLQQHINITAVI
jgi:hypothetical protein